MRSLILTLALAATANAAPPESFWRALHQVESSGRRTGLILGDQGRSRGPLQIQRAYHADSGVAGPYERVDDLAYSRRVVTAYLRRYARAAWERGDAMSLARVHNGGPSGTKKRATLAYARKVVNAME
jgi:hypothetical protein